MGDERKEPVWPKEGYEPPRVEKVFLRPEEAVLGGCKTASSIVGPSGSGCLVAGSPCIGQALS